MTSHILKYSISLGFLLFQALVFTETIDEIVVNGDWRQEEINKKNSSLIVFSEEDINKKQYKHFEDLTYAVPNLNFAASDSRPRYFQIRGIGERSGYEGTPNSSVGFLIDNIDFSGQGGIASSYDIDQVEIYRGPQGSRMGANALAGMVYIKTKDPEESFQITTDLTVGDYGRKDIGTIINVPVNSEFKYRLSLKKTDFDGFRNNTFLKRSDTSKKDEQSYRFKAKWDLSEDSFIDFVYFNHDFDDPADIWTIDGSLNTLSDRPGMDSQDSDALGMTYYLQTPISNFQILYSETDTDVIFSYDADWGNSDSHDPYIYDYFSETLRNRESSNLEFRFLSNDLTLNSEVNFEWIFGASLFKIDESNKKYDDGAYGDPFDGYGTYYSESFFSNDFSSESKSLFGNINYFFNENIKLSFGMRWEDWKASYLDSNQESFNPSDNMNGGKISLTKTTDNDLTIYISSAKGYKQGGFNLGTGLSKSSFSNDINYQPESLINYEVGINKYLSSSRTYLDIVFFFSDRRDQQVLISTQVDPQDPNTFLFLTRNAAEGVNYGGEMSLKTELSNSFSIFIDLGLLKTEIKNYASRPDLEGREQAHAPSYSFSSGFRWNITEDLEFLFDVTGKSDFYYSDSHDNQSDDYVLTNLNVAYTSDKLRYNFWVKNLFDEYYSLRGFYFGNEAPNFEDTLYERHGDPRNLGLSIQYEF